MTTSKGDITIDLFPEEAPNTVANWHKLASAGFYDGLAFHRVIPGFVAQGGCPEGTGAGGPGWVIACETKGNPHKHKQARCRWRMRQGYRRLAVLPGSGAAAASRRLHTVFGQVAEGLDVMQNLESRRRDQERQVYRALTDKRAEGAAFGRQVRFSAHLAQLSDGTAERLLLTLC